MPLDPQRTLLIGAPENSVRARKSNFFDALNVNEFQLIAWNAITFTQDLLVTGVTLQHPCAEGTYDQFQRRYNEKLEDILAWIKDGHVFVIFPFVFSQPFQVVGSVEWPTDINQFFPFHLANLRQAEGEFLEPDADFAATFSPFARLLKYVFVLAGENIRALFRTGSSRRERSQIAGGICPVGKGAIVFSPWPKSWTDPELVGYFEALAKIPDLLNRALDLVHEWTDAFQSERERGALTEIANREHKIAQVKGQSDAKKSTVSSERTLKLLYSGTDNSLVVAAATAIEELGLKVVNGPRVRADLLIWDGQRRLASAEVKGLEGPARENHHRQAVRWAADVNSA